MLLLNDNPADHCLAHSVSLSLQEVAGSSKSIKYSKDIILNVRLALNLFKSSKNPHLLQESEVFVLLDGPFTLVPCRQSSIIMKHHKRPWNCHLMVLTAVQEELVDSYIDGSIFNKSSVLVFSPFNRFSWKLLPVSTG